MSGKGSNPCVRSVLQMLAAALAGILTTLVVNLLWVNNTLLSEEKKLKRM